MVVETATILGIIETAVKITTGVAAVTSGI